MESKTKKLYCYVDETGQDAGSEFFIVVSVVSAENQQELSRCLLEIEQKTRVGQRKWHKTRSPEREEFLKLSLKAEIASGQIYYGRYQKPLPFFLPLLETITKAIQAEAKDPYQAIVYIDGIDKKKAKELTNALRLKGISTSYVRSARDESEPMIRLADRWAGCIRASYAGKTQDKDLVTRAISKNQLKAV